MSGVVSSPATITRPHTAQIVLSPLGFDLSRFRLVCARFLRNGAIKHLIASTVAKRPEKFLKKISGFAVFLQAVFRESFLAARDGLHPSKLFHRLNDHDESLFLTLPHVRQKSRRIRE